MLTLGGRNPTYGTMMTFDLWGVVVNVMICKKFGLDRLRYPARPAGEGSISAYCH